MTVVEHIESSKPSSPADVKPVQGNSSGVSPSPGPAIIPPHDPESLARLTADPDRVANLRHLALEVLRPAHAANRGTDWIVMRQLAQGVLALDALVARQDRGLLTFADEVEQLRAQLEFSNPEADSRGDDPPRRSESPLEGSGPGGAL